MPVRDPTLASSRVFSETVARLIWQPTAARHGDMLEAELRSHTWRTVYFAIAFAKSTAVALLQPAVDAFRADEGVIRVFVGLDHHATSEEALRGLLAGYTDVYVVHNPGVSTFHPKAYLFENEHAAVLFVGSSNLTVGGLYVNVEANLRLELDLTKAEDDELRAELVGNLEHLPAEMCVPLTAALIDELLADGLIWKEAAVDARSGSVSAASKTGIFTHVPVPPPPRLPIAGAPAAAQHNQPAAGVQGTGPLQAFTMVLSAMDAAQQAGHSRDALIPLAARRADPAFWGWPGSFKALTTATGRHYNERYPVFQIHPRGAPAEVVSLRLYHYRERGEFRLNCRALTSGAAAGDLLVIEKSADPAFEYEATIVAMGSHDHQRWMAIATEVVQNSNKQWGYA